MSGRWWAHLMPGMGLSSNAIAGLGSDHPYDPSDLIRRIAYCNRNGITTEQLAVRMAGRSPTWARLVAEWDHLVSLVREEVETRADGTAPRTYAAMRRIRADGVACPDCDATGRGVECPKCKGSGRRSGGRCRAPRCYDGADFCSTCRGNTYLPNPTREEDR